MNASQNRSDGLDILRSVAIWCIVFLHFENASILNPIILKVKNNLWIGVDLFFVLSGFLISSQIFNEMKNNRLSLKTFFVKRIFRILPNYYLVLVLLIALRLLKNEIFPFWKYFLFIQNFSDLVFFLPSWSLCVEVHFYIAFSIIVGVIPYSGL